MAPEITVLRLIVGFSCFCLILALIAGDGNNWLGRIFVPILPLVFMVIMILGAAGLRMFS